MALIAAVLAGLLAVQVYLLWSAFKSKEQAFNRNVMSALGSVSRKLSATEIMAMAFIDDSLQFTAAGDQTITINIDTDRSHKVITSSLMDDEILRQMEGSRLFVIPGCDSLGPSLWLDDTTVCYRLPSAQNVELVLINALSGERRILIDTFSQAGDFAIPLDPALREQSNYYLKMKTDSVTIALQANNGIPSGLLHQSVNAEDRRRLMMHVVAGLQDAAFLTIEDRIDPVHLDSILARSLAQAGIDLEHTWAVTDDKDSVLYANPPELTAELLGTELRSSLFPTQVLSEPADLLILFPDRGSWLWWQMIPIVLPAGFLSFIFVGCFAYSIRTFLAQRRFAERLIDFIGNMTHEFRTPLSTILLAGEAIARDDVVGDPGRVRHFNETIIKETKRMKGQTDKILQMAALEEGDLDLQFESVDVHELIASAARSITLHVEQRQGRIECDLQAEQKEVMADPVHLANVFANLLDNANRYSSEKPNIRVTTRNENGTLRIQVIDNGIGMTQEHTKAAFDKYFRVPQGNVHNAKGFGLGLSYVKLIMEAHHGEVLLHSQIGEGTQAELIFPASQLSREVES